MAEEFKHSKCLSEGVKPYIEEMRVQYRFINKHSDFSRRNGVEFSIYLREGEKLGKLDTYGDEYGLMARLDFIEQSEYFTYAQVCDVFNDMKKKLLEAVFGEGIEEKYGKI